MKFFYCYNESYYGILVSKSIRLRTILYVSYDCSLWSWLFQEGMVIKLSGIRATLTFY